MNCGTCVDLPQPVSPLSTTTEAPVTARVTSSLELLAGRFNLAVIIANPSPLPVLYAAVYAVRASDRRLFSDAISAGDMAGRSRRDAFGPEEDPRAASRSGFADKDGFLGAGTVFAAAGMVFGAARAIEAGPPSSSIIAPAASNRVYTHGALTFSTAMRASFDVARRNRSLEAPAA